MYLNTFAQGSAPLDMTGTGRVPQPAGQRGRTGHPARAGRALPVVQHRAAADAVPLPGMGPRGRAGDRAAAWRPSVGAFMGSGQPAPGAALPRAGAGPAWPRRQRVGARRRSTPTTRCRWTPRRSSAAMGLQQPVLIGHSMGGRNAMLLMRRNQARLRARGDRRCRAGTVGQGPRRDRRLRAGEPGIRRPGAFRAQRAAIRSVPPARAHRAHGEIQHAGTRGRQICQQMRFQPAPPGHRARHPARWRTSRWRMPAAFDLPVLLVRGANSNILAPDAAERFAAALPQGTLVTVPETAATTCMARTPRGSLRRWARFLRPWTDPAALPERLLQRNALCHGRLY